MNKSIIAVALAILLPLQVFAAQQPLQTRANTTSPSVDTNFTRQQAMNTDLYTNKADKTALGTAAALNVGTAPSNLVQLDSEGKLPAIDASKVTGITGTLPNGTRTGQTVEWNSVSNTWLPVDWNTITADGTTMTITGGVLSEVGAAAAPNNTVKGRNSFGVLGYHPISDYVTTSGAVPIVQVADPISTDANGIYIATGSNKAFVKTDSGLTSWAVTISPWDTTPDQWEFTAQTGLALSTDVLSNEVTVSGINYQAPISAVGDPGCGYSKNSLPCSNLAGTIVAGDKIKACVTTSPTASSSTTCMLSSNGVTAQFQATTAAAIVSSWVIEDNFNENTITNYTRINGTAIAAVSDGALYNTTGNGTTAWLQHSTTLGSSSQTVQAVIQDRIGSTAGASSGLLVRSNGTTGHGCWVDIGDATHRFTCEALGGSGTAIYAPFAAGAWVADTAHLVEISVGADNIYHFKIDFNDDGDFLDVNEDVGASSANASFTGTYAGVGFRTTGTAEKVDSFKAKVYAP